MEAIIIIFGIQYPNIRGTRQNAEEGASPLKQRMMEVVMTAGAISRAKLQSNHYHQQTRAPSIFTGAMPFLSPNLQCQSTEGKISHSMDLLTTNSPGGLPAFVFGH